MSPADLQGSCLPRILTSGPRKTPRPAATIPIRLSGESAKAAISGSNPCNSDKALYYNTPALHHSAGRDSSTSTKRLIRTVLYIAIAAFAQQARCSQLESFTSDVQATVGVVHPEKSGAATLHNLEISQGLSTSDQVILNPSDSLTDGMSVRITEPGSLQASSR